MKKYFQEVFVFVIAVLAWIGSIGTLARISSVAIEGEMTKTVAVAILIGSFFFLPLLWRAVEFLMTLASKVITKIFDCLWT